MINICETCRHRYKRKDQEPCKKCGTETGSNWEPQEEKRCSNCRYEELLQEESPCKECINQENSYEKYWEPKEAENEEKGKEDKGWKWPCFEKLNEAVREMGKDIEKAEEIKLEKRPGLLALPVPIYERTDSEIPEKVRISFTNGTSAIYALQVDQPAPQLIECVRIIRKWNNGYKAPTRRRRRK